jgi:small subunit ribosomal protein S5e
MLGEFSVKIFVYRKDLRFFFTVSVEVKDISLTDYIQVRHAVYVPHTAGRYAKKQFKKAQMPIVERLVDRCALSRFGASAMVLSIPLYRLSLMMKGRNNGKKLMAVRIVAHAFEIIHLLTDQNPIQVREPHSNKLSSWLCPCN